jgi:hypothetical protein
MLTTALLDLEGLPCRMIHELTFCEREQRVRGRFAGEVLKSSQDERFTSFIGKTSIRKFLMVQQLPK